MLRGSSTLLCDDAEVVAQDLCGMTPDGWMRAAPLFSPRTLRICQAEVEAALASIADADVRWMALALWHAMRASPRVCPNPAVGCVIVKKGAVLSAGATEPFGGRHAERCAIDAIPDRDALVGATIYSTLEPCAHHGKQPPCADLVADIDFARCVVGVEDPNPKVSGAGLGRVQRADIRTSVGVLRDEVLAWHLPYLFGQVRPHGQPRPFTSSYGSWPGGSAAQQLDFSAFAGRHGR